MAWLDLFGTLGALIVIYANLPQVLLFIKQGHAQGISKVSVWLGLLGLSFRLTYVVQTEAFDPIIVLPYGFSLAYLLITLYYCYYERK